MLKSFRNMIVSIWCSRNRGEFDCNFLSILLHLVFMLHELFLLFVIYVISCKLTKNKIFFATSAHMIMVPICFVCQKKCWVTVYMIRIKIFIHRWLLDNLIIGRTTLLIKWIVLCNSGNLRQKLIKQLKYFHL